MAQPNFMGVFNNHPIPGQSLTRTPGSSPTQRPPQFADVNDALEFLWGNITNPRMATRLLLIMKKGTSAEYIARAIAFQGFMTGKWTPDVALLLLKTLMRMIVTLGESKGIKVHVFNKDKEQEKFLDQFLDETPQNTNSDNDGDETPAPAASDMKSQLAGGLLGSE